MQIFKCLSEVNIFLLTSIGMLVFMMVMNRLIRHEIGVYQAYRWWDIFTKYNSRMCGILEIWSHKELSETWYKILYSAKRPFKREDVLYSAIKLHPEDFIVVYVKGGTRQSTTSSRMLKQELKQLRKTIPSVRVSRMVWFVATCKLIENGYEIVETACTSDRWFSGDMVHIVCSATNKIYTLQPYSSLLNHSFIKKVFNKQSFCIVDVPTCFKGEV